MSKATLVAGKLKLEFFSLKAIEYSQLQSFLQLSLPWREGVSGRGFHPHLDPLPSRERDFVRDQLVYHRYTKN
jgi:hypothetical protein